MKKPGIIGGIAPESTITYYREITTRCSQLSPDGHVPELSIESVDVDVIYEACLEERLDDAFAYLLPFVRHLEDCEVDFITMASIAPHLVFDRLAEAANVPMLDIMDPTYRKVHKNGLKKVLWLGTMATMEQPYFWRQFRLNDIEVIVPNEQERCVIEKANGELEKGGYEPKTKLDVIDIVENIGATENVQGVILGCTELPFMLKKGDLSLPIFDTMENHIQAIVDRMMLG